MSVYIITENGTRVLLWHYLRRELETCLFTRKDIHLLTVVYPYKTNSNGETNTATGILSIIENRMLSHSELAVIDSITIH